MVGQRWNPQCGALHEQAVCRKALERQRHVVCCLKAGHCTSCHLWVRLYPPVLFVMFSFRGFVFDALFCLLPMVFLLLPPLPHPLSCLSTVVGVYQVHFEHVDMHCNVQASRGWQ